MSVLFANMYEKSVIIPTKFETVEQISRLLRVLGQILTPNDQILVIDGSEVNRNAAVEGLDKDKSTNIRWIDDPGRGITAARNVGVQYAEGNLLIFVDGDCLPTKTFIDVLGKTPPNCLTQARFTDRFNNMLGYNHALWRSVTSRAAEQKNQAYIVNGRGFAIPKQTLDKLGDNPFGDDKDNKHGGEDRRLGQNLLELGVNLHITKDPILIHYGDPVTLHGLLRQKYTHARGNVGAGVLHSDTFTHDNFRRAVLEPVSCGVNPNYAILFWSFYLLGAFAGLQNRNSSSPNRSLGRQY